MYNHFMFQSQYWQQTLWTWLYLRQAGSSTVYNSFVKNILYLWSGCQSLTSLEARCPYKYCWFGDITRKTTTVIQSNLKTQEENIYLNSGDAWIIWEADICGSSGSGCLSCRGVIPSGRTRAYPLSTLYTGETEQLSRHLGRLQAGAEGAWMRLLHGLCSRERGVLWGSHSSLWRGAPLYSEARWGQTSPCSD